MFFCQGVCRRDSRSGWWRDVHVVGVVMALQSPPGSSLCCGTGNYTNESRTTAAFTTFTRRESWSGRARHTKSRCRVCVQSVCSDDRRDGKSLDCCRSRKDFRSPGWMFFSRWMFFTWDHELVLMDVRWSLSYSYCDECISVHYIVSWFYVLSVLFSTWITEMNSGPVFLYSSYWLQEDLNWKCVVICVVWSECAQYFLEDAGQGGSFL